MHDPLCADLRRFVTMAQENPEKFPTGDTAARDEEADQKSAAVSPEDRSLLTRGFARAIAMGDTFAPNFSLFHQPIVQVQVIAKSVATKYYNDKPFKVHTLNVVDGDDKMVVVKVNTVLNDSVGLIQIGGVVQLTDYVPLYFHYKN